MIRKALPILCLLLLAAPALAQQPAPLTVYLWPPGHPTLQGQDQKEIYTYYGNDPARGIRRVANVHNPSIEVHLPPAEKSCGAAIITAPGGGHSSLGWDIEGVELAPWLAEHGVATIVLKYRLARNEAGIRYRVEDEVLQDTQRAVRIVRANAKEWGINPERIGVMGWSAGANLAALVNLRYDAGKADADDPIERVSCKPNFICLVYGAIREEQIGAPPREASPVFIASAGVGDRNSALTELGYANALLRASIPVELHIYGSGEHAGGIRPRGGIPFETWHHRFIEWMADLKLLTHE